MPQASFEARLAALAAQLTVAPDKPEETPESTLRALWLLAAGSPTSAALAMETDLPPLDDGAAGRLDGLVAVRLGGTPLAYLTGRQRFMGLEFAVEPGALIPRVETELLAGAALAFLRAVADPDGRRCLDIGTGSGNLAVTMAALCPGARVLASDVSEDAARIARRNVDVLGVGDRVSVTVGDLFGPFESDEHFGRYPLVLCNPPYVSSTHVSQMPAEISGYEPAAAFDGGFGGMGVLRRLLRDAPRFLAPGGRLMFEVGAGQGEALLKNMSAAGTYRIVEGLKDGHGTVRAIVAGC
jgi:release factor glutamine methyltransferase